MLLLSSKTVRMVDIRRIRGKPTDMDKAAEELKVPKESLMKYNRPILQEWAKKQGD